MLEYTPLLESSEENSPLPETTPPSGGFTLLKMGSSTPPQKKNPIVQKT